MAKWLVSKQQIEIFVHPNADSLDVGKVGNYQVVVQKGLYKTGDEVIFCPEKSILTGVLLQEYCKWLVGPEKNRVKGLRLRGELSMGIIIPQELIPFKLSDIDLNVDVSEKLGISKWVPIIPSHLEGECEVLDVDNFVKHDVEQASIYTEDFIQGEDVIVTEKLHGSQINILYLPTKDVFFISNKNKLEANLHIAENKDNHYWKAFYNSGLKEIIQKHYKDTSVESVQLFGEMIPIAEHKQFKYGQSLLTIKLFSLYVNEHMIEIHDVEQDLLKLWVPVLYIGPIELIEKDGKKVLSKKMIDFSIGNECVSVEGLKASEGLHIREGCVIMPLNERRSKDGTRLKIKVINPSYAKLETGDEIN